MPVDVYRLPEHELDIVPLLYSAPPLVLAACWTSICNTANFQASTIIAIISPETIVCSWPSAVRKATPVSGIVLRQASVGATSSFILHPTSYILPDLKRENCTMGYYFLTFSNLEIISKIYLHWPSQLGTHGSGTAIELASGVLAAHNLGAGLDLISVLCLATHNSGRHGPEMTAASVTWSRRHHAWHFRSVTHCSCFHCLSTQSPSWSSRECFSSFCSLVNHRIIEVWVNLKSID